MTRAAAMAMEAQGKCRRPGQQWDPIPPGNTQGTDPTLPPKNQGKG